MESERFMPEEAKAELSKFREEYEKEKRDQLYSAVAKELSERREKIDFPGLNDEAYFARREADAEYPGFSTPIDEIIAKMKAEGIKVVLGTDPKKGDAWILPHLSDNREDSVLPRQLIITANMDPVLRRLIELSMVVKKANQK